MMHFSKLGDMWVLLVPCILFVYLFTYLFAYNDFYCGKYAEHKIYHFKNFKCTTQFTGVSAFSDAISSLLYSY